MVAKVDGINLGQGVCRMPTPSIVLEAALSAIQEGKNLYSPAAGIPELRQALAEKCRHFNKIPYAPENILVTIGGTGAFETFCQSFLNEGDEVINFAPYYPYHHNALTRHGAKIKYVELSLPEWSFDREALAAAFTKKTKFIIVNTPGNPTGKVFTKSELEFIAELCLRHDVICVTDEVYEYMTYDHHQHHSMAAIPEMFERTITTGSYSKTFAVTGWRIGYLGAPLSVIDRLRSVYDSIYVCAPTPLQHAVAVGIKNLGENYYSGLKKEYTKKRQLMYDALNRGGFAAYLPQGAYYMIADARSKFPGLSAKDATQKLISETKVGAVPASDFIEEKDRDDLKKSAFFRFCYSVPDEMIAQAAIMLQ